MVSRATFSKNRRQLCQEVAECILGLDSGVRAFPKSSIRWFGIAADRASSLTDTDSADNQYSLEGKLWRNVSSQHGFRIPTRLSFSDRRLFSSAVLDDRNTYDPNISKKNSLRAVKPEDQTSSQVRRLLTKWTVNTPMELAKIQVPWNPFIVCGVLKSNIRADAAWQFFKWVKSQGGYRHNVYTYSAMIDLFGKARDYSAMGSLLKEMQQEGHELNVVTYTTLMHWYRQAMDLNMVRNIWKQMDEKAVRPNVITYTTYIDALVKGNCHQEAMEVYRKMQESGCRPNIYTYTVLIHSLVGAGKIDAATELFDKLGDVDCKPNSVTFSLLIHAHSKAGNFEKVLTLFKAMKEGGVRTSQEQRRIVIRALQGLGMVKEAEQLLSGMDEQKLLLALGLTDVTLTENHAVTSGEESVVPYYLPKPKLLAKKLRVWGAETDAILEQVGKRLKPPYVMNVLKELRTNAALAWRFFLWAETQEGYKHTQYTYMKIVELAGRVPKSGSNKLMEKVLAQLEQEGTSDLDKFNTLIKYYSEYQNIGAAEKVFNRASAAGCTLTETTYTLMIDMYSRAGMHVRALTMYEEMQNSECKPSMHTYTVLMYSLARSGKIHEAEALFESLPSLGHRPNVVTYTALIQSLLNIGQDEKALALFERMKEAKISPTRITLKVLAKGLRNAGRLQEAEKIEDSLPYMRGMFLEPEDPLRVSKGEKEVQELVSSNFSPPTEPASESSFGEPYAQTAV